MSFLPRARRRAHRGGLSGDGLSSGSLSSDGRWSDGLSSADRRAVRARGTRPGTGRAAALLATAAVATALVTGCGKPASSPAAAFSKAPVAASPSAPATPTGSPAATATASPAPSAEVHAPADFVALSDVDPTILQDIRYSTPHNFVGRPVKGYLEPMCILTRQAAEALHRVQTAARARGYSLKMYDCYRPQRAVDDFTDWGKQLNDQKMKGEFYPTLDKSVLFDQGYIAGPTAHSRGSTMDLTLVALPARPQRPYVPGEKLAPCTAPQAERFPDNSIDMGTGFDCFDSLTHTLDPRVTGQQMANRLLLKQLMGDEGFINYPKEWWHYSLAHEPYPDTYFDFPVARAALTQG